MRQKNKGEGGASGQAAVCSSGTGGGSPDSVWFVNDVRSQVTIEWSRELGKKYGRSEHRREGMKQSLTKMAGGVNWGNVQ